MPNTIERSILSALADMGEVKGSSLKNILDYNNVPSTKVNLKGKPPRPILVEERHTNLLLFIVLARCFPIDTECKECTRAFAEQGGAGKGPVFPPLQGCSPSRQRRCLLQEDQEDQKDQEPNCFVAIATALSIHIRLAAQVRINR